MNSIDAKPGEKFVEGRPLAEAFNDGRMGMKKLFECRDRYPELKKKGIANILTLDLVRYGCVIASRMDFTKGSRGVGACAGACVLVLIHPLTFTLAMIRMG